jgi:hypothetical protein
MGPRWTTQRDVHLELWTDRSILAGEYWQAEIDDALAVADFGLLCVSASFLASPYIDKVELPALMTAGRIVIPLALEPLDLRRLDLKGLDLLQIFHLARPGSPRGLSFEECRGVNSKRFGNELVGQIVQRLSAGGRLA